MLLRRTADFHPDPVGQAVRRLGATRSDLWEANKRWRALIRSSRLPYGARRYAAALGPPEAVIPRRLGDLDCTAKHRALPLWPGLRFDILLGPAGGPAAPLNEWLVRAPGLPAPTPRVLADLTPWSCVVADVAAAFPPAMPHEGSAPTRRELDFTAPDATGRPRPCTAEFSWGLLREVRLEDLGEAVPWSR
ncbi:hypothetical protein [Kitasatospora sp. NBC_00240]|uniref:hypothetical protein n=1 Tax=Kitasatospora sp. NBC_00240 TaxID=2903567 RepID=UPI002B1D0CCE|nr:hypothetical protein [Kitasatospora sp. NBC_00240]